MTRVVLALLAASLFVRAVPAQDPRPRVAPPAAPAAPAAPTTTPIRTDKDGFVLPAGHFSVQELIDAAARFLQRNILYSEMEMPSAMAGGFFHFQKELALDALGCEEVLGQLLYLKGYALLELDAQKKIYEVVFMGGQRAREVFTSALRRTPEEILQRPRLKQVVFTEVKLEHINANIATNALRPFFAIGAGPAASIGPTFGTAGSNSVILISGFQDQVAQMIQLLRACDVTGPEVPADVNERIMRLEQTVQQLQQQRDEGKPAGK